MNTRIGFLAAIFIIAIVACIVPVAAGDSYLEITSDPSSSWACLDHWNCHDTPVTFSTDPNSYHSLSVYEDGYQLSTLTVYASGPNVTTPVRVVLVANSLLTGILDIDSSPTNADVWVDERYYGETRQIVGGLAAGTHALRLKKAGYYDYLEQFTVAPAQTTIRVPEMTPYAQSENYGDIQVRSAPVGAAVFVNGNYEGTTISTSPLYVTELVPGTYSIRVTLADFAPYTETAVVKAGLVYDVHATLFPVATGPTPGTTGPITIRSVPAGANIYLDNAYRGITPLTLVEIPQGSHAVILKLNGYQDWTSAVNVIAGSGTDVTGTLVEGPVVGQATLPPQPTKSPVGMLTIISAIGICGAAIILVGKKE
jgi:hypothetical protein